MSKTVSLGFELNGKVLPIASIMPARLVDKQQKRGSKYASVLSSIQEVGVIEPPIVYPIAGSGQNQYMLLDGHLRVEALKDLGEESVFCLISTDDEGYTYNHKVNRLVPIQEHFMIMRALERGVSEERIATALKVDVVNIRMKRNLLNGICADAVELLKDKPVGVNPLYQLKRVKPARQIEIAEIMNVTGNYGYSYILALVAATPKEQLVEGGKKKTKEVLAPEHVAQMQREMESLQRDLRSHEETYGENFLNLVLTRGYLTKLLDNARIVRFLLNNHPDMLAGLRQVVESASLDG